MGLWSSKKIVNYYDDECLKKYTNRSKGEKICHLIVENLFEKKFTTVRPVFLSYDKNNKKKNTRLEIDIYNEDLKFGIEYQGKQHYIYNDFFHNGKEEFIMSCCRDDFKRKTCYKHGVFLLEIPYFIEFKDLGKYICERLPQRLNSMIKEENKKNIIDGKIII